MTADRSAPRAAGDPYALRAGGPVRPRLPPVVALAVLLVLDLMATTRRWPIVVQGLIDEPAHLLTAWLILRALPGQLLRRDAGRWALLFSVAIDIDHMPLYLTDYRFAVDDGRPPTHSLALICALVGGAFLLGRHFRELQLGAAVGVGLHFIRDLATGPGVPLLFPVTDDSFRVPHGVYLAVVGLVTVIAVVRPPDGRQRPRRPGEL
jgi:inner membrane protein